MRAPAALLLSLGLFCCRRFRPDRAGLRGPRPLAPATFVTPGWAQTTGGAGGRIVRVTTLASDGPGSLKAALDTLGPRTIVRLRSAASSTCRASSWPPREGRRHHRQARPRPTPASPHQGSELEVFARDDDHSAPQHPARRLRTAQTQRQRPRRPLHRHRRGARHRGTTAASRGRQDENLSTSGEALRRQDAGRLAQKPPSHRHHLQPQPDLRGASVEAVHAKGEAQQELVDPRQRHAVAAARQHLRLQPRAQCALQGQGLGRDGQQPLSTTPAPRPSTTNPDRARSGSAGPTSAAGHARLATCTAQARALSARCRSSASGGVGDVELFLADNLAVDRFGQPPPMTAAARRALAQIVAVREPHLPAGLKAGCRRSWSACCRSSSARGRGRATRWTSSSCPTSLEDAAVIDRLDSNPTRPPQRKPAAPL